MQQKKGHVEIVRALIEAGAEIDKARTNEEVVVATLVEEEYRPRVSNQYFKPSQVVPEDPENQNRDERNSHAERIRQEREEKKGKSCVIM